MSFSLPLAENSGMCVAIGSESRSFPSSTSRMIAVAVATGFVSEARSKTVSVVIGSSAGRTARRP